MQPSKVRSRVRIPSSCTECRRRKQKCTASREGPCYNCLKRYPPVECVGLPGLRQWQPSSSQQSDYVSTQETGGHTNSALNISEVNSPRIFGGRVAATNTLNGVAIKSTMQNSELLYIFHEYVMPNYVTIDGQNLPPFFIKAILPWMIQSPLMPNIAILMAACSQKFERGIDIDPAQTLAIRSHVLGLVNEFLKQDFSIIADEAVRAVCHLVILEWWWGKESALWAHMNGIKEMLRLQGGMRNFPDPTLEQVLTLTDYELACCYERELYFDYPKLEDPVAGPMPINLIPQISLMSPLHATPSTFTENSKHLNLTLETASILDDIRFLTLSISHPAAAATVTPTSLSDSKIKSTALWLHTRITNLQTRTPSSHAESVAHAIRLSALVYTSCIQNSTPFSLITENVKEIKEHVLQVPMVRWKEIPGIFLWLLLVISPSCGTSIEDRGLQKKMAVTGMAIGLEGFGLGIEYLKTHWLVQRWVANQAKTKALEDIP